MAKPKIAILMDENTSAGATQYEAAKTCFAVIAAAGGLPFGVPYLDEIIPTVSDDFDALITLGGRFAYPPDWYIGDTSADTPKSDRFEVEKAIVSTYLTRDKPILGICAGMQMLACLHGCKLTPDLRATVNNPLEHDKRGAQHDIAILPGSTLFDCVGVSSMKVNSFHREAIAHLTPPVIASAHASDGVVEAIELPAQKFALGLQWHQEHFVGTDHVGNKMFNHLVQSC